jgi:hypothetical protein
VLVVPISAVSLGADGASRIEVEREPVTDDSPGRTESVPVEVGLTADGLVEIRPIGVEVDEGDRVVVGTETPTTDSDSDDEIDTDSDEPAPDDEPGTDEAPPDTAVGVG